MLKEHKEKLIAGINRQKVYLICIFLGKIALFMVLSLALLYSVLSIDYLY